MFLVFHQRNIYIKNNNIKIKKNQIKLKTSLKRNQGCEDKLKPTNLATALQFKWLREQRFKNLIDKIVNTMEHVK